MMSASFGAVDEKLRETDFFLTKMQEADLDFRSQRYYFSAFVTAARSVTFALQHSMASIPGFEEWYEVRQDQLKADSASRFFKHVRNEVQKRGTNPVTAWSVDKGGQAESFFV